MLTLLVGSSVISPDLRLTPENLEEVSGGFACHRVKHSAQRGVAVRDLSPLGNITTVVMR